MGTNLSDLLCRGNRHDLFFGACAGNDLREAHDQLCREHWIPHCLIDPVRDQGKICACHERRRPVRAREGTRWPPAALNARHFLAVLLDMRCFIHYHLYRQGNPAMSSRFLKILVIVTIVFSVAACDQVTKGIARANLTRHDVVQVIGPLFVLHYVENQGAFLGLGATLSGQIHFVLLILFPVALLVALAGALLRRATLPWPFLVALSLIAGGGFGNLIDRMFRSGRVTDFMMIGIGNVHTGIFNVADLAITAGCAALFVVLIRRARPQHPSVGR